MNRYGLLAAVTFVCLHFTATRARADGPYEGAWQAGPTRIAVAIHSWGSDCGPQPQSVTSHGGGSVQISQDGDNLVFHGSRTNRTDTCWSENTAVRRVSTTAQVGQWRTVCRTPTGDSRGETGTYVIRAASPSSLEFRDVSEYDWQLNTSHCTATITTTQTFSRSQTATPTPPTPTPPPVPTPPPAPEPQVNTACTPGAAARLNLLPPSTTLAPGERVCMRARVLDAHNCAVPGAQVSWNLEHAASLNGELRDGCFRAGAAGPGSEGEFRVVVTSGALRDVATIRVHTTDLSDLIARRGETGLVGTDTQDVAPTPPPTPVENTNVAVRETEQPTGSATLVAIVSGIALLLAALGFFLVMRSAKKTAAVNAASDLDSFDAYSADSSSGRASVAGLPPATENMICPVCRRGYAPGSTTCETDGTALLTYPAFNAQAKALETATSQRKLCPMCGERYSMETTFCGKDGTTLVIPR